MPTLQVLLVAQLRFCVRVSRFEAGLAVFMCTHRMVLASFVFRLSSLSLLCSCAHRWVPACLLPTSFVLAEALHVGFFFFTSLVIHILLLLSSCLFCWKLRLRLSRQAVKFGHVALFECFNKPGWATLVVVTFAVGILRLLPLRPKVVVMQARE